MRWRLTQTFVCLALLGVAMASAGANPEEIALKGKRGELAVVHDGAGHYIAVEPRGDASLVFYGDGKVFYRLSVKGYSRYQTHSNRVFWAPNAGQNTVFGGSLTVSKDAATVSCGERETRLRFLDEKKASDMLSRASFRRPKWKRKAVYLARDEDGRYYLVDRIRDSQIKGWRLFIGRRGKMKRVKLKDVVEDSGGVVFATGKGELSFENQGKSRHRVTWSSRRAQIELTDVPPGFNGPLIYNDLGAYRAELGTPCDHM